jgi:hypothetical protein
VRASDSSAWISRAHRMQSAAVFSIEAPWQARSTLALVHGQGFRHLLFLEKDPLCQGVKAQE